MCPAGVGGSTYDPHMTFHSVAADAAELLEHLGLGARTVVAMGTSGEWVQLLRRLDIGCGSLHWKCVRACFPFPQVEGLMHVRVLQS